MQYKENDVVVCKQVPCGYGGAGYVPGKKFVVDHILFQDGDQILFPEEGSGVYAHSVTYSNKFKRKKFNFDS